MDLISQLALMEVDRLCSDIDLLIEKIESVKIMFELTSQELTEATKEPEKTLEDDPERPKKKRRRTKRKLT